MHISTAVFVKSVWVVEDCPDRFLPEFAFIGRSNVGKSALINMLIQRNSLAKSSRTPGKTQLINFFCINDKLFFVDLPWYGYAKATVDSRKDWIDRTQDYFHGRPWLQQVFILIDGSIPPQNIDISFCSTLFYDHIPFSIIVTKIDKAKQSDLHKHVTLFKKELQKSIPALPQFFLTSSVNRSGREEIRGFVEGLGSEMS